MIVVFLLGGLWPATASAGFTTITRDEVVDGQGCGTTDSATFKGAPGNPTASVLTAHEGQVFPDEDDLHVISEPSAITSCPACSPTLS